MSLAGVEGLLTTQQGGDAPVLAPQEPRTTGHSKHVPCGVAVKLTALKEMGLERCLKDDGTGTGGCPPGARGGGRRVQPLTATLCPGPSCRPARRPAMPGWGRAGGGTENLVALRKAAARLEKELQPVAGGLSREGLISGDPPWPSDGFKRQHLLPQPRPPTGAVFRQSGPEGAHRSEGGLCQPPRAPLKAADSTAWGLHRPCHPRSHRPRFQTQVGVGSQSPQAFSHSAPFDTPCSTASKRCPFVPLGGGRTGKQRNWGGCVGSDRH